MRNDEDSRRGFLLALAVGGTGVVLKPGAGAEERDEEEEELVTPGEDLMREHGVLNRVLLVYEECIRRIKGKEDLDPQVIAGSADIVRTFIEDYHEKLEEEFVFPRLRQAQEHVETVDTLIVQHEAGRRVTERIRALATSSAMKDETESRQLTDAIGQFIRMYRPHEAREDTVIFPALQRMMAPGEYAELGERFEGREHELFGEGGFQEWVDKVAGLERAVGIHDLAQFNLVIPTAGG